MNANNETIRRLAEAGQLLAGIARYLHDAHGDPLTAEYKTHIYSAIGKWQKAVDAYRATVGNARQKGRKR